MKNLIITLLILACVSQLAIAQNVIFHEGFDNITPPALPSGWTQEKTNGSVLVEWETLAGGHQGNPTDEGYDGTPYNAIFQYQSSNNEATMLITPPIDLTGILKPELRFAHAQDIWYSGQEDYDQLKVYYKRGADSAWVLLKEYLYAVTNWEMRNILLPDSSLSSTYYIGFEGITGFGHGTLIDTVHVVETGIIPLYIESVNVKQNNTNFIPTGTNNNPILRIEFNVSGNQDTIYLDSLSFVSLNTSDSDIKNNGVKIYATEDTIFSTNNLIGATNYSSGIASFDNIGYSLPRGITSIWLTYDIKEDLNHEMYGHIADAMVEESSIKVEGNYYPFIDKSPNGSRVIYESIFIDDFETDKGWRYTGDFERAIPQGLHANSLGSADPDTAFSGSYIIGNDLTSDGNYSNNLADTASVAEAPTLNLKYYKNVTFSYYRWLNIQSYIFDKAKILVSTDVDTIWEEVWGNPTLAILNEKLWNQHTFDLSEYFNRNENAKLKFSIGPTNDNSNYTGWNIDDVVIVGNYIAKDVGITDWLSPIGGCGYSTDEEYVEVTIKNYAGEALNDPIPVSYSFDGGATIKYDTILNPNIPVDGSINYVIDKPANLTTPGWYNNVYATTHLSGDEDNTNNRINKTIFITPTYTLPYSENFETNYGYYLAGGLNSTWEYGVPTGSLVNSAASGTKAWVTNLDGDYETFDSSYIVSPCFDFTGIDSIVFEFKCKGISEDKIDGLTVLYSIDNEASWHLVPNDNDYYWNWYTEELISALELPGIDTTNGEWMTFRQLLPPELSNQSSAKFRFAFESSPSLNFEGFGIDDVRIYEAPYDVGISAITEPFTDCYWSDATQVKVDIENFGITPVKAGTKIPIGLKMNDIHIVTDTLELENPLALGGTTSFTFTKTVNMSNAGNYEFVAFTLLEDDSYFYNETTSNDTTSKLVTVQGMPNFNPFQDQIGVNPVDTFLAAGTGYSTYTWSGGGSADITPPNDTLYVSAEGLYYVTVTNAAGCAAEDSVEVVNSEFDIKMDHLYTTLDDVCERTELTELSVRIKNNSLRDLTSTDEDTIFLAYQINELPKVEDTLIVTTTIAQGATEDFTFTKKADFTTPDSYTLKVFVDFLKDLNHSDDTIPKSFLTKGYVDISFDSDTIYSSEADTLVLSPEPTYTTYSWSTAESTANITPATNVSQWYYVTVSDDVVCDSDNDSIYVETYDFALDSIKSPRNSCEFTNAENIELYLFNHSGNDYPIGTKIPFKFNFDGLGWVDDTVSITSVFNSGTTEIIKLNETIDPSLVKDYSLDVMLSAKQDANKENDVINHIFSTFGYPNVELAFDTIFTTRADTVVLVAQDGFLDYQWNDEASTTNDTLVLTERYSRPYIVTVHDVHGCGSDSDTTQIIAYNLSLNSIVSPSNECGRTSNETVTISIKNSGMDTIRSGTIIPVGYILDNGTPVNENFVVGSDILPSKTANHSFGATVDLSTEKTYTFKVYTAYKLDVNNSNDTLVDAIKTFGYPEIELGDDIYTTQPETVSLAVPSIYTTYEWNTGNTTNTLNVTYPASKYYSLTVTDINGCTATDDINVYTYDVAPSALNTPVSDCVLSNAETVSMDVVNSSQDTLLIGDRINVSYVLNSGSPVNESFTLADTLKPGETVSYTFSQKANLSANQEHQFNLFAERDAIDVETNDDISTIVDYLTPDYDLGIPVTWGGTEYTIDAGAGYASYLWFDNSTSRYYTVDINSQNPNNYYTVTVTTTDGCTAEDSIKVTFSTTADLSVTELFNPTESKCWNSTEEDSVHIEITNVGVVNIPAGESFTVGYLVNNGNKVTETFNLSSAMNANDTREYVFDKFTYSSAGNYKFKPFVTLSDDGDASNDTLTSTYTIAISQPEVDFVGQSDTIYFDEGDSYEIQVNGSYLEYEWDNGETTASIVVTEEGAYTVIVTDQYDCQAEGTFWCLYNEDTGFDNIISGDGYTLSYYPNPATDKVMIELNNRKPADVRIEIVGINGQLLFNTELKDIETYLESIDVNKYANGIYYLRFRINGDYYTRKLIVQ